MSGSVRQHFLLLQPMSLQPERSRTRASPKRHWGSGAAWGPFLGDLLSAAASRTATAPGKGR